MNSIVYNFKNVFSFRPSYRPRPLHFGGPHDNFNYFLLLNKSPQTKSNSRTLTLCYSCVLERCKNHPNIIFFSLRFVKVKFQGLDVRTLSMIYTVLRFEKKCYPAVYVIMDPVFNRRIVL